MGNSLIDRYLLAICKHNALERIALKALLKANELRGLALGVRLAALRDSGESLQGESDAIRL